MKSSDDLPFDWEGVISLLALLFILPVYAFMACWYIYGADRDVIARVDADQAAYTDCRELPDYPGCASLLAAADAKRKAEARQSLDTYFKSKGE